MCLIKQRKETVEGVIDAARSTKLRQIAKTPKYGFFGG
jgi:hypothetical protein